MTLVADRHRVALADESDFAGFREAARQLLAAGVAPDDVDWRVGTGGADLFGPADPPPDTNGSSPSMPLRVSRAFLDLAGAAALHRDPGRFALIYRLLWRMREEPQLIAVASDADVARLTRLAKAVRRDIHKMHAFVRFRSVADPDGEVFVAWYEPDHHIVDAAASFFVKRFAALRWSILTPERCLHWRDGELIRMAGADRRAAPGEDALEALWRSYYAHVFNPARVNPDAMRAEMPKRFWKNLPEAQLIPQLVASAPQRTRRMIESAPTVPVRRRGAELDAATGSLAPPPDTLAACRGCPLWQHATQPVAGEGPPQARMMIIGEQPGDQEDLAGRPFVGPAGRLLDDALQRAGISRGEVYVTNAVKHFKFEPRGKRRLHKRPAAREIAACRPWLEQELMTVRPHVVVLLGASAAEAVLGRSLPVTKLRGTTVPLREGVSALVTTHPAYVLRLPTDDAKKEAFEAMVRDLEQAADLASGDG